MDCARKNRQLRDPTAPIKSVLGYRWSNRLIRLSFGFNRDIASFTLIKKKRKFLTSLADHSSYRKCTILMLYNTRTYAPFVQFTLTAFYHYHGSVVQSSMTFFVQISITAGPFFLSNASGKHRSLDSHLLSK